MPMNLKIVTPDGVLVEQEVDAVYGNTIDGSIGILPNHIPLLTPLKIGVMSYLKAGKKEPLAVMGGLLYTDGKSVTVLSDAAELSGQIDVVRAQQAKEKAEAQLHQKDTDDTHKVKEALTWAETKLSAAPGNHK